MRESFDSFVTLKRDLLGLKKIFMPAIFTHIHKSQYSRTQ
jgi:hypothetical protein